MKFNSVAAARRRLWDRLRMEIMHLDDLGVLMDEDCEDDFDRRRMTKAIGQVRRTLSAKAGKPTT